MNAPETSRVLLAAAGTAEDYDTALYTEAGLRRAGVDVRIEPMNVTLSYPISRSLRLLAPTAYAAQIPSAQAGLT